MFKKLKKIIGPIHLWLGLSSGIVVFILGVTGSLYVFEEELRPIIHDYYFVDEVQEETLPLSKLFNIANDTLKNYTNKKIDRISIYNDKNRTVAFSFYEKDTTSKSIWYWDEVKYVNAYLNPYSGEVVKIENANFEFFRFVFMAHWSLLLKNDIGQPIVGVATIIFVIMLITGLVLWWPKNKKAGKQRFWFRWKDSTQWKRKNYDLHNILGFYVMIFALVIALTGLVWAFDWFNKSVQWVANGGKIIQKENIVYQSDTIQSIYTNPIDKVWDELKKQYPNAKYYSIRLPKNETDVINTYLTFEEGRTKDIKLFFDQYSGEYLYANTWKDKNNGEKVRALNYDIHVGSIFGFPGKILAFSASLIAASLPITGFYIWWGRKKKSKKSSENKICIGSASTRVYYNIQII